VAVTISPTVMSRRVNDEVVLIDVESEGYFGLNRVGAEIWVGLSAGAELSDIVDTIVERFHVSEGDSKADVWRLVAELEAAGLVKRS
jgi:Coenzyme PQQ synthesis protein D (PqqD)